MKNKVLRTLYNKFSVEMTDEEFMLGTSYGEYVSSVADGILSKYGDKTKVIVAADKNENSYSAYTDGKVININAWCDAYKALMNNLKERHWCVLGRIVHECGHILWSNFPLMEKTQEEILHKGKLYPAPNEDAQEFEDYLALNEKVRAVVVDIFHEVFNRVEDGFIEKILVVMFPGYGQYLKRNREFLEKDMKTVKEMRDAGMDDVSIICSLILYQAKFYHVPDFGDEKDSAVAKAFYSLREDVNNAVNEMSSYYRMKKVNDILVKVFALIKEEFDKQQQQSQQGQQGGDPGSSSSQGGQQPQNSNDPQNANDPQSGSGIENQNSNDPQNGQQPQNGNGTENQNSGVPQNGNDPQNGNSAENQNGNDPQNGNQPQGGSGTENQNSNDPQNGQQPQNGNGTENQNANDTKCGNGPQSGNSTENQSGNAPQNGNQPSIEQMLKQLASNMSENAPKDNTEHKQDSNSAPKADSAQSKQLGEGKGIPEPSTNGVDGMKSDGKGDYSSTNSTLEKLKKDEVEKKVEQAVEQQIQQDLQMEIANVEKDANIHKGIKADVSRADSSDGEADYNRQHEMLDILARRMMKNLLKEIKDRQLGDALDGNYFGNRLDTNNLFRRDKKLYIRDILPEDIPDMEISILIDGSGSMGGAKMEVAIKTAYTVWKFCQMLKIPVTVLAHSTSGERVVLRSVADGNSIDGNDGKRIFSLSAGGCNRDGFALRYALKKLLKSQAQDRIMFVISDGQPNHRGYGAEEGKADIRDAVAKAKKEGVLVITAGIGSSASAIRSLWIDGVSPKRAATFLELEENLERLPKTFVGIIKKQLEMTA